LGKKLNFKIIKPTTENEGKGGGGEKREAPESERAEIKSNHLEQ